MKTDILTRSLILLAFAVVSTWFLTPQLSLAASSIQAKTTSQKNAPEQFSAADAFSIQSANLRTLMLDLYECNPQALQKSTKVSKEEFVQWVFEGPFGWQFDAIRNMQSTDALTLSFSTAYRSDRVLPLITGLYTMLLQAYGGKNEFTFTEVINPQKMTIAMQNVEISAIKLLRAKQENGEPYLSEECNANVQRIFNNISKHINADASRIAKKALSTSRINPFQMDENTLEFTPF
ncbi:MAG: hypothetical protein Q8K83_06260 [Methylotenera sp.]|nr:hypothetical protein [Methylotenera sp.]MDP1766488.1 hypothetical protein [Methylotenera sp.]